MEPPQTAQNVTRSRLQQQQENATRCLHAVQSQGESRRRGAAAAERAAAVRAAARRHRRNDRKRNAIAAALRAA